MANADPRLSRYAAQRVRTSALLGVDFHPRRDPAARVLTGEMSATRRGRDRTEYAKPAPATVRGPSDRPDPAPVAAVVGGGGGGRSTAAGASSLDELRDRHARECPHCTNATGWTNVVFGEGRPDAALMFIGEAPGQQEDETGRPFVGRAGQKLDEIIKAMGMEREDVYIANVLKTRPPNNRTPLPDEVAACSPYLVEQIRLIEPRVIVTLGGPATKLLLDTKVGITRLRGSWAEFASGDLRVPVMPTFHPAYLLRNYTKDTRQKVWSDMQAVMKRVGTG